MSEDWFLRDPADQSLVKTTLVTKYFNAWSKIMIPQAKKRGIRIAYIDLFSGPGGFGSGTYSTPIEILQIAIDNPELRNRLVTIFNDKDSNYVALLQKRIDELEGVDQLNYRPVVRNDEVGDEIAKQLQNLRLVPTLFFIDPWGYKGLSLDLIGGAIRNWGCDCIFFFNYNRINLALNNPFVQAPMRDLFGETRAAKLGIEVRGLSSATRQAVIMNAITEALHDVGGRFTLPFEFKSTHGDRTSHYIIFVSKNFRGYDIMKDVMAGLSHDPGEVSRFQFLPRGHRQLAFIDDFDSTYSTSALKGLLLERCGGQRARVRDIYEKLSVDTPYRLRNFQKAMLELEDEGKLVVEGPGKRRMVNGVRTLGDTRFVVFGSPEES